MPSSSSASPGPAAPVPPVRLAEGHSRITVGVAVLTWCACWLGGNLLGSALVAASGHDIGDDAPIWVTLLGALGLWIPIVVGLVLVSRRFGTGSVTREFGLSFRPVDLLGIPIGALTQLVLLRLLYWPLESIWPDTFSSPKVEESARTLYERADGGWLVALVGLVVVGAPLIEELLYRGLLLGAFRRRVDDVVALVVVALWFALIHFRPVEYPGLVVVGLVLGVCVMRTGRLGMSVFAHMAFNATGLIWVATR
ncbi:MAG: CPBP family intramembrane glutamic endopeptidase [Acidimicrobiales bacterium]